MSRDLHGVHANDCDPGYADRLPGSSVMTSAAAEQERRAENAFFLEEGTNPTLWRSEVGQRQHLQTSSEETVT